jgi:twitching motility two-component system response regulator PilH
MSRILAVDDSPTVLQLLSQMLAEGHHDVIRAVDGVEAIRLAVEQQPDLVLLDVILPKLNGYQVCRQLKAMPETAAIPVILITRKAKDEDRQWGVEQGADGYITKPFTTLDLLSMIRQFLPPLS